MTRQIAKVSHRMQVAVLGCFNGDIVVTCIRAHTSISGQLTLVSHYLQTQSDGPCSQPGG